tara:strand:- start:127 stop:393 length:267 start_codon:yes stop_codon:yes gene_type:complete
MSDYDEFLNSVGHTWDSVRERVPQFSDFVEYCQFLLRKYGDGPLRYTEDIYNAERSDLVSFWELDHLVSNIGKFDSKSPDNVKYFIGE